MLSSDHYVTITFTIPPLGMTFKNHIRFKPLGGAWDLTASNGRTGSNDSDGSPRPPFCPEAALHGAIDLVAGPVICRRARCAATRPNKCGRARTCAVLIPGLASLTCWTGELMASRTLHAFLSIDVTPRRCPPEDLSSSSSVAFKLNRLDLGRTSPYGTY